jgi:hypothetical protein
MRNSIAIPDPKDLPRALADLSSLDSEELNERWKALFGGDPPARFRPPLMIQALAYRLQEKALGGLKPSTRRLLQRIAGDAREGRPIAVEPKHRVKPGAVLIREWHGTKQQVTVIKDGFMFNGKRFQSLSKIAFEITGTHWSGPLFFGLRKSGKEENDGAR